MYMSCIPGAGLTHTDQVDLTQSSQDQLQLQGQHQGHAFQNLESIQCKFGIKIKFSLPSKTAIYSWLVCQQIYNGHEILHSI